VKFSFIELTKTKTGRRADIEYIPPPCLLPPHILRPALCLFPLFLPQDPVNALLYLLDFFQ